MQRSDRADRLIFRKTLRKLAFFCVAFIVAGGMFFLAQYLFAEEANDGGVPAIVYIEMEYEEAPELIQTIYPLYEEIFEEPEEPYEPIYIYYAEYIPAQDEYRPIKRIALTFDDGPLPITGQLLDILDYHGGRVTFCVIGNLVERGADTVRRAYASGHEIIGHSWTHANLAQLSRDRIIEQIQMTSEIIEYVTGTAPPPIFRAPYGLANTRVFTAAESIGYSLLNWGIDPQDWKYRCEYHIYDYIMENARDGAIVVLHDVHQSTIDAMYKVIPALMERGFELVTASEIIYILYGGLEPGFEFTGVRR